MPAWHDVRLLRQARAILTWSDLKSFKTTSSTASSFFLLLHVLSLPDCSDVSCLPIIACVVVARLLVTRAHCICRCHTDITLPRREPNRFDCACALSIRMYHTPTPACDTNGSHWWGGGRLMQKTGFIKQQLDDKSRTITCHDRAKRSVIHGRVPR